MTIYVLTSDKGNWLIEGLQYCISKYWPHSEFPLKVKILGWKPLEFELNEGFEFISLGHDHGPDVNHDLFNFFTNVDDEYFIFTCDDHFPIRPINSKILSILLEYIQTHDISRVALDAHVSTKPYTIIKEYDSFKLVEFSQASVYRQSAVWSIWSRDYFTKYLSHTSNLWEWEDSALSKHDGHIVIGTVDDVVVQACHLIKRGELKDDWYKDANTSNRMHDIDQSIMKDYFKKYLNLEF